MSQKISLNLDETNRLQLIGKALSVQARIDILKLLCQKPMNVNEIADCLNMPQSSAAAHIRVLEEASLIKTELMPGIRGTMKQSVITYSTIEIMMNTDTVFNERSEIIEMPIGHYVDYKVEPTCGIAGEKGPIGEEDEPRCFYHPDRSKATLLWLGRGYVEYRFPNDHLVDKSIKSIILSAEMCSEDHEYNMDFKSDITVWINECEIGTWTCPSDFGGRRGKFNPEWWPDKNTQYGLLKTWRVDNAASYLDNILVSKINLKDLKLLEKEYISVRIGIKEDAKNQGGMNLFGQNFGDYEQSIILKTIYK